MAEKMVFGRVRGLRPKGTPAHEAESAHTGTQTGTRVIAPTEAYTMGLSIHWTVSSVPAFHPLKRTCSLSLRVEGTRSVQRKHAHSNRIKRVNA